MNRLSPKVLMVIAVILSIGTAGLIYNYLQANTQQAVATEPVIVAVKDIPGRTVVSQDMVKIANVPTELIQPGSFREMNKVVGVMARVPISAGDQVTDRRLVLDGKVAGFVGAIPKDKRAFTIPVSDVTGVAGFVKAGDYVDIIATVDKSVAGQTISNMVLQNVLVLAANRNDNMENAKDKKELEKMVSVTLAISPDESPMLALASEKGKLSLALRPFQSSQVYIAAKTYSPEELVAHNFIAPKSNTEPVVMATVSVTPAAVQVIRGTKSEIVAKN